MGLRATFPAAYATEGLDLVGATLAEPWFERQEWDRVRDELLEEVRTVRDRPGEVAQNATWAALYPSHPWRLPPGGTEASLGRLGAGALRRLHDRILTGRNLVVAVAGPVTADDAIDVLAPWLRELPGGGARIGPRPRPGAPRTRLRELHAGREQCTVQLGVRVGGTRDPDRLALGVLAAILGGQGGRLFLALREREGLGYAVWADPAEGVDGGVLTLGLSTEPGREVEALRALRAEVARLRDAPPTGAETLRYRRMLQGHAAMALQRASGRAGDAAVGLRFALPWGLDAHRAALASVTPEAVATLARRLAAAPWVPVVVHPGA